ncbi:DUF934 domain-containing protein [Roseateles terrae]|uniref:Uncharacterized protein (DUF934 family) n=1 Tax=Roseateles terrae TaxID=431060 RepID=A0ABR6GV82_9BURK|nr:DUF934 domain-containing protein [Roseateles terrae]MBB3195043.1 uncharacterized protein (DUF934 family) [Roseateles terrae]OWQ87079.1 hypothetical protein CDN98_09450 [Roseateles terrae]
MKFVSKAQDPWHLCTGEDGPQPHPAAANHKLLTLEQWHAVRDTWPAGLTTGVLLPNDADVADLAADLPRLSLVVVQFPKWVDGRAYTQARLLRVRHRFTGEIRAIGDVLVDMMPLLQRCGVDAVQMRADQDRAAAERALGFFPGHYQGDVVDHRPAFARDGA